MVRLRLRGDSSSWISMRPLTVLTLVRSLAAEECGGANYLTARQRKRLGRRNLLLAAGHNAPRVTDLCPRDLASFGLIIDSRSLGGGAAFVAFPGGDVTIPWRCLPLVLPLGRLLHELAGRILFGTVQNLLQGRSRILLGHIAACFDDGGLEMMRKAEVGTIATLAADVTKPRITFTDKLWSVW